MGPGRDRTRDPWICSQTRICSQARYRLRYAARVSRFVAEFWLIASVKREWFVRVTQLADTSIRCFDSRPYKENHGITMSKTIYWHEHKHRLWVVEHLKPSWFELSNTAEYIRIMCVLGRHTRMSNNDCLSLLSIHDFIEHACFDVLTYVSTNVNGKLKQKKTWRSSLIEVTFSRGLSIYTLVHTNLLAIISINII